MLVRLIFLLLITNTVVSQPSKDEYTPIFNLLKNRQYSEAELPLKKYLKEITNPHPSAILELGNIYYTKAIDYFLIDDDNKTVSLLDSAVYFYQKAAIVLTESHYANNAHYYQHLVSEKRKELKFSQVQNDLDTKIRKINKKLNKLHRKNDSITTLNIRKEGKYHALIIGASEYKNSELNLEKPILDAKAFQNTLVNYYTFDVRNTTLLLNPTRQAILKELVRLRKELSKHDNLLIFFAGHGYWDADAQQGYWWPIDGDADDPTFWLSNSDLRDQIRSIKTAHTLLISDACFSGGILKSRDVSILKNAPADIILLYKHPSRRAMTSGSLSTVPDNSIFFQFLVSTLENNSEKYISSQAIFDHIRKAVINNSMVVPHDGVILDTGDEGGDFIFIRKH
jgi:hypothetical protein